MSAQFVCRHVKVRSSSLRSFHAELSQCIRTHHHGVTSQRLAVCAGNGVRNFFTSRKVQNELTLDEKVRKALDGYKETIRHPAAINMDSINTRLNAQKDLRDITVRGYLGNRRDLNKGLSFSILRNSSQTCCIQVVSTNSVQGEASDAHEKLRSLKEWTPVLIRGQLRERHPPKANTIFGMELVSKKEISLQSIEPLNEISSDLIIKQDTVFGPEHRHLQLRTDASLRKNLIFRNKAVRKARDRFFELDFKEIETPILFKSTPEGAREFLVPTRNKGLAYALPQSPQQYKQILMASGFDRYFQFARCFRDEDLRADRQPEFTQVDIEMAFANEEDVMNVVESLIRQLWNDLLKIKLNTRFQRMTYQEAMASYGSDKPDLRFPAKITNLTKSLPADLISKITPLNDPSIEAFTMTVSQDPKVTRKFITKFLDSPEGKPYLDNADGQPGVFVIDPTQPMQGLGPLGYDFLMSHEQELDGKHGGVMILQARKNEPYSGGSTVLGNLRLALHKAAVAWNYIEAPSSNNFRFVWIHDFPLFTPENDSDPGQGGSAGFSATHHPFTAPKSPEDVELLLTAPEKAVAAHYDIVLNGVELGGGSRRIHNADVQEFVFRDVLKMKEERIEDFRHLLDVLRSGCPPHAGIALGWDRLMAVMCGTDSVRDVIAFPKSGKGEDLLVKSPNRLTPEQLDTYHLQLKD